MALDPTSCLMIDDDILNFSLDGEDEDLDDKHNTTKPPSSSMDFSKTNSQEPDDCCGSFPEFAEEELEWLSNKDAFPALETCFDIITNPNPNPIVMVVDHLSPVSVLENSASSSHSNTNSNSNSTITNCCGSLHVPISYPVKKRSKRRRKRRKGFPELPSEQCWWWNQENMKKQDLLPPPPQPPTAATGIGRRCQHCLAEKTPQWRAGPMGPKTLCNACGVRYKSGRLVPEYRPASSPTFSSVKHSNSHRKIMEMRKHSNDGGKKGFGYGVG
ncbi:GATA transcription factor 1 [Lactuca sativa]|uniref:GATA-type domain-containing protein n=1 Tax=Lactuca sativa TaxID=4236 RepID=A0A9R1WEU7_LACSA|nr:GATA transcription factor 1 [Lactuca sativa]KAJ0221231.1 hypothetical protein LSAT_V11C200064990 [Lactuca sativa]